MSNRAGRPVAWNSRPMQVVDAVGLATTRGVNELLLSAALAVTVLVALARRTSWRRVIRVEHVRVLHNVTVRCLFTTVVTGMLLAVVLVTQAVYWLAVTGTTGLVGPVIVVLLLREITPIVVGLILFGRSGTVALIELSAARRSGWQRLIELQGLDPLVLLVLPRCLGFALGAFCLGTVLLVTTLATSYFLAYDLGLIAFSIWEFAALMVQAMKVEDFVLSPLKCVAIGFLVALSCCASALGRSTEGDDLTHVVPLGFVRATLSIILVSIVVDLAY